LVGFTVEHVASGGSYGDLDASFGVGLTDDLSVRALVAPLLLWGPNRGVQYGEINGYYGPGVGASYRFVRGRVELALALTGRVFTVPQLSGASVVPAILFRAHATENLRLDVDPTVTMLFGTQQVDTPLTTINGVPQGPVVVNQSLNRVRVSVPASLLYNLDPSVDAGVTTGLTIFDAADAKATTAIPAGVFLGYAIPGAHGPAADVRPFFSFPQLVTPGQSSATNAKLFQVGVDFVGYLYL
jgi:hypothetical protein